MKEVQLVDFRGCVVREANRGMFVSMVIGKDKFKFTFPMNSDEIEANLVYNENFNHLDYIEIESIRANIPEFGGIKPHMVERLLFWPYGRFEVEFHFDEVEHILLFGEDIEDDCRSINSDRYPALIKDMNFHDYQRLHIFCLFITQQLRKISLKNA